MNNKCCSFYRRTTIIEQVPLQYYSSYPLKNWRVTKKQKTLAFCIHTNILAMVYFLIILFGNADAMEPGTNSCVEQGLTDLGDGPGLE